MGQGHGHGAGASPAPYSYAFHHDPRTVLRTFIAAHFGMDDLRTLAFDLGLDVEDLRQERKTQIVLDLIQHCERYAITERLMLLVLERRPAVSD